VRKKIFLLLGVCILGGCASVSGMGKPERRTFSPEFRQKVGLYVHDAPERISYYGSAATDISDLMSYHLQTTLPSLVQEALLELFDQVEIGELGKGPDPKIVFKTPDLAGYFEVSILNVRYDYPEADLSSYRAEVQFAAEFKTPHHDERVWREVFEGTGLGFSSTNLRLTDFGRGSAAALEEAFQNAVDHLEDGVEKSQGLRNYLRGTVREGTVVRKEEEGGPGGEPVGSRDDPPG